MLFHNDLVLGLDLGIASCGWALIRRPDTNDGEIVAMGVWTFDAPETDKERTPTNQLRRQHRGLRRVFRRRRQRMAALRALFIETGLICGGGASALRVAGLDPWVLRAAGLDRPLKGAELAVALGHIAKHRGFKSNSKRDRGANAPPDSSKMLKAVHEARDRLARWRTVGEMFARDEAYAGRKRNRDGEYTRTILRDDQAREVALLFDAQRRMGSRLATPELEAAFVKVAFFQRPLQDSDHLVGFCPFAPGEKRAARRAPSFERFRLLSRLAALRLQTGREEVPLGADQIAKVEAVFGLQKRLTYKSLRKLLDLGVELRFAGVPEADEAQDFVSRSGAAAEGTAALRGAVIEAAGELAWRSLQSTPEKLDAIASVLTFRDDLDSIRAGFGDLGLEPLVLEALMSGTGQGAFSAFKGAGHISAKACRTIIPHLRDGLVYSEACARAGWDHAARPQTKLEEINNPVAKKALGEALKQVKAIVQAYGVPDAIHVELAREVGKSKEERDEIRAGIERRNKEKDRLRKQFREDVGAEPSSAEDLLRYELWREQNGRCLYSDAAIHPSALVASDRSVEVDHILPWSRSGDDSFINKTLCLAAMNQEKRGRTPF